MISIMWDFAEEKKESAAAADKSQP